VYALLTETGKRQLRMERIAGLEGDHFRVSLQLEEAETADEVGALSRQSADLERRLAVHHAVLDGIGATASTATVDRVDNHVVDAGETEGP
jgi:hypothetical protein